MGTKTNYHLTPSQARTMLLAAQGLIQPPERASKADVLAAIRRMGVLQIDTINVVNRSPYLVLWSRLGAYPLDWLNDLLAERAIFEYWSHAACFLPIEDYALHRRMMLEDRTGKDRGIFSATEVIRRTACVSGSMTNSPRWPTCADMVEPKLSSKNRS